MQNNNLIYCKKYHKNLEKLDNPPFDNELGIQIFNSISKQAWDDWIIEQTKLINENQFNLINPKHRKIILSKMQNFLCLHN